jgi:hypothetical protein
VIYVLLKSADFEKDLYFKQTGAAQKTKAQSTVVQRRENYLRFKLPAAGVA